MDNKDSDERFRELLEKIDPGFRRARLRDLFEGPIGPNGERIGADSLQAAAFRAIQEVNSSARQYDRLKRTLDGDESDAAAKTIANMERQNAVNIAMAEHYVAECESVMAQIAELDGAGIAHAPAPENGAKPSRAVRRRAARK